MINYKKDLKFQQIDSNTERAIIMSSEKIMMVLVKFKEITRSVELHSHEEEQMTYILSGKAKFIIEDKEYIVGAGDSLTFESNQKHGCIVLSSDTQLLDIFSPPRIDFL